MKQYWRFYWPLAFTGAGLVLSVQFQNAVLARYPDAIKELAILAIAYGIYGFFNASLGFVGQLTNVYARSPEGTRKVHLFVICSSGIIATPLAFIATTKIGNALIAYLFPVEPDFVNQVQDYLILLCPLVILNGQRHFYSGLLIQAKLTGWITIWNTIYLSLVVICLIVGFSQGLQPNLVIVGSELVGVSVLILGFLLVKYRFYSLPSLDEQELHKTTNYMELTLFFLPVSTTGIMFALSRPILYGFVSRTEDSILTIAALRVAFDFTMLFQQAANQFRHFFITFGESMLDEKVRFMRYVAILITSVMLIFILTPISDFVWGNWMSLSPELRDLSTEVVLIMCLMPCLIVFRNYFHSRLMTRKKTNGMAAGSILRVAGIYLTAMILFETDSLSHTSAACTLLLGFLIEALVARSAFKRTKAPLTTN